MPVSHDAPNPTAKIFTANPAAVNKKRFTNAGVIKSIIESRIMLDLFRAAPAISDSAYFLINANLPISHRFLWVSALRGSVGMIARTVASGAN